MLAFSIDYYGMIFRATQSVELFCAYFVSATAIIIGYATLTHIDDSKNCSTVLHNCMLLSHLFLPRENYTTISLTPIFRAGTPVEQCAHTVSNEIFTPVGRNLHVYEDLHSL